MESIADRLSKQLETIVSAMDALLERSTILDNRARNQEWLRSGVFTLGMADYGWGPLDDHQRRSQRELLKLWTPWAEQFRLIFSNDTKETENAISEAEERAVAWIQRDDPRDHSVPSSTKEAKRLFRLKVEPFFELLRSLTQATGEIIAVPDTNVLIRSPDVTKYGAVLGTSKYTVLLVPGVLHELDGFKTNHRIEAVREKARSFGSRIKGWRRQGKLSEGVKVQGDIWVRVEGREPDLKRTLSWLDPDVEDDRIVASILETQRLKPHAKIVLLSGDSIMLAKADAANIPTEDTPDPEV
jgi:PIN domain